MGDSIRGYYFLFGIFLSTLTALPAHADGTPQNLNQESTIDHSFGVIGHAILDVIPIVNVYSVVEPEFALHPASKEAAKKQEETMRLDITPLEMPYSITKEEWEQFYERDYRIRTGETVMLGSAVGGVVEAATKAFDWAMGKDPHWGNWEAFLGTRAYLHRISRKYKTEPKLNSENIDLAKRSG